MSEFFLYFHLGFGHILDIKGYDHIIFIVVLSASYMFRDWKELLVLTTAFTIGHSASLALSAPGIVVFPTEVIEFLIPVTIFLTAGGNLLKKETYRKPRKIYWGYLAAFFFGLIHGVGFSNYLRALLGKDGQIIKPLLAFNLGLEIGQIVIVLTMLTISYLTIHIFGVSKRDWKLIISSAIAGMALLLMMETKFW